MASVGLPLDPLIGRVLKHYRIQDLVGGVIGVVYRACDEHPDREVALKFPLPDTNADGAARWKSRNEALPLSKLNHPHIARVLDFDTDAGLACLVMEFIYPVTLSTRLLEGSFKSKFLAASSIAEN